MHRCHAVLSLFGFIISTDKWHKAHRKKSILPIHQTVQKQFGDGKAGQLRVSVLFDGCFRYRWRAVLNIKWHIIGDMINNTSEQ